MAGPVPLAPVAASGVAAMATRLVAQASAPSSDILNWGATGVLGLAFLYLMYALAQNRIVSRDAADHEKKLVELAEELVSLLKASQAREDRVSAIAERQMGWLEGRPQ